MSFMQEFKEFALKGNALDLAVGIILGAAFNKIVNSLVVDILMPPFGLMIGGVDFKNLQVILKSAAVGPGGEALPAVAMRYGLFLNSLIEFVIVALSAFVVIRIMNRMIRQRDSAGGDKGAA